MKKNMKTMLCFGLMIAFVIAMSALLIGCAAADPDATTEVTTEATTETTTETTEETTEATTEETTEATEETTEATEETTEATESENTGAADGGNGEQGGSVENTGNTGNTGNAGNTGNTTETKPAETTPAGPTLPSNKPGACEHNWSGWTVTKGATTMAEGEQIRSCSKCGKSETQTIPKVYINVNELIAAGNSYAASLGFTIDTSLNEGNAGYFPGLDYPLQTMADGYSMMATAVATTRNQLMHWDYTAGYTESPDVFLGGYRCSCNVTYAGESDMGPIYIFWVYYS